MICTSRLDATPHGRRRRRGGRTAAALLAGALLVVAAGCSDDPSGSQETGTSSAGTVVATADDGPPAPEPIMLGKNPAVSPCQLLPTQEAEAAFGKLPAEGYVEQELIDRTRTPAEMDALTDGISKTVYTRCSYEYGGATQRSVQLLVHQYRTAAAAAKKWQYIKDGGSGLHSRRAIAKGAAQWIVDWTRENEAKNGGVPVAGAPDLLFVEGRRHFTSVHANLLVEVSDTPSAYVFRPTPMSPAQYAEQVPRMKQALDVITARAADPAIPQEPVATVAGPGTETTPGFPYLEPCRVLDSDVFEAVLGRADDGTSRSTSLRRGAEQLRDTAEVLVEGAPHNDCERSTSWTTGKKAGSHHSANLRVDIRYAGDPVEAMDLMEQFFVRTTFAEENWDEYTLGLATRAGLMTDVDTPSSDLAYVLDTTPSVGKASADRQAFFTVGPYAVSLEGEPDRHGNRLHVPSLSAEQYTVAIEEASLAIRELAGMDPAG